MNICKLVSVFLIFSNCICFGQNITGYFYIDEDSLNVHIENKEQGSQIIIEGLRESLLLANFFNSKDEEVNVYTASDWSIVSAQNWTRLFEASPDGANMGSIHNVILTSLKFPSEEKKAGIKYLIFTARVMRYGADRRIGEIKEVNIRLEVKSRESRDKN